MAFDLELVSMVNYAALGSAVMYLAGNLRMKMTENRVMLLRELTRIELKKHGIGLEGSDELPNHLTKKVDQETLSKLQAAAEHGVRAWAKKGRSILNIEHD